MEIMYHAKRPIMKRITYTFFFITSTLIYYGQSLFFDSLNNSNWASEYTNTPFTIQNAKKRIPLKKINSLKDSLKTNLSIWNFKDERLTITNYNYQFKTNNTIAVYNYEVDLDKAILKINLNDKKTLNYKVGINSAGNYALLIKVQEKK